MGTKEVADRLLRWLLLVLVSVSAGMPSVDAAEEHGAKKLAIVPFTLPAESEGRGWLSDGFSRVLAVRLERLGPLKVWVLHRPDSSGSPELRNPLDNAEATAFLDRIRPQGYDAVLFGSFHQIDTTLRLEIHLWSTRPSRQIGKTLEQFPEQDLDRANIKLAAFVVTALQLSPTEAERRRLEAPFTTSAEAFERFARALTLSEAPSGKEDITQAVNLFKEALNLDGKFSMALRKLADLHLRYGHYESAVEAYETLVNVVKRDPQIYRLLGSAHFALGEVNRAIDAFKRGVQMDPRDPMLHLDLGLAYTVLKDYENATKELLRTLEFKADDPLAFANLGVIYLLGGKFAAATSSLRRAQLSRASDPMLAYNLGLALVYEGVYDQALDQFERALQLRPDFPAAAYQLALLQERIDASLAVDRWKKYLDLAAGKVAEEPWIPRAQEHSKRLQEP